MKSLYAVVLTLAALACASVQPAKVELGDRCLRCRRPIADLKLAGEVIDAMRAPFPFRTAGCLAKYVKANSGTQLTAVFVTDFKTGRMIPAGDAWFVPVNLPVAGTKSIEADYYAFRTKSEAAEYQAGNAQLLRWPQVVSAAD
jgi:hypothetical protein